MNRSACFIYILILLSLLLAACAPASSTPTAPQPAPTNTADVRPTSASPTNTLAPTASPTMVLQPTPVAFIPANALAQKGKLLICTDFPYPPQEFFDAQGNPQGTDIDIGNEIARHLGLQAQYVNSVFDTIVAAVQGGKCDIIISAMNITPERNVSLSMIPYFQAGQALLAQKGNPVNINSTSDLCGKAAAAQSGSTEANYLQGVADYTGRGLTQECVKNGKPPITVVITQKDSDALLQLQSGKVVAYFADSPVAAYYVVQHPDLFQFVGQIVSPAVEGIAIPCGEKDCANAPLSPLGKAVEAALRSMMADGTYMKILNKWQMAEGAVTLE